MAFQLDELDHKLIRLLRLNGRRPNSELAAEVGLSASAVKRRIDRLVADGVIRGFTVQIDPKVEGLATEAYVELFCRGTVSPADLKRMLAGVPEVVEASTVTGKADAIVMMRARDVIAFEEALEKVRAAASVDHTTSAILLSKLISRNAG